MNKFFAILNVLRKGESVADPEQWKTHQINATVLALFLTALVEAARVYGYNIPVDQDSTLAIAGGIVAAVNVFIPIARNPGLGVLPARSADASPGDKSAGPNDGSSA